MPTIRLSRSVRFHRAHSRVKSALQRVLLRILIDQVAERCRGSVLEDHEIAAAMKPRFSKNVSKPLDPFLELIGMGADEKKVNTALGL